MARDPAVEGCISTRRWGAVAATRPDSLFERLDGDGRRILLRRRCEPDPTLPGLVSEANPHGTAYVERLIRRLHAHALDRATRPPALFAPGAYRDRAGRLMKRCIFCGCWRAPHQMPAHARSCRGGEALA